MWPLPWPRRSSKEQRCYKYNCLLYLVYVHAPCVCLFNTQWVAAAHVPITYASNTMYVCVYITCVCVVVRYDYYWEKEREHL